MVAEESRELEAALICEHDVHEDDVRVELVRPPERLCHRRGDADDLHALPLEQHARSREELPVVIDDENAARHTSRVASNRAGRIAASRKNPLIPG
jgi:hypothetical protein